MRLPSTLVATALAAFFVAGSANAAVIGFDELANDSSFATAGSVDSGGFHFINGAGASGAYLIWGRTHPSNADFGGATLSHNYANTTTTMSKLDGGTFSLLSIDFGDVYNRAGNTQTIQIVGTKADLSTVTETVTTDALVGLETFSFSNFDDLVSVTWTPFSGTANTYLQLDNVVVDAIASSVAEPMSLGLFGSGLAALAMTRLRRRKTV